MIPRQKAYDLERLGEDVRLEVLEVLLEVPLVAKEDMKASRVKEGEERMRTLRRMLGL